MPFTFQEYTRKCVPSGARGVDGVTTDAGAQSASFRRFSGGGEMVLDMVTGRESEVESSQDPGRHSNPNIAPVQIRSLMTTGRWRIQLVATHRIETIATSISSIDRWHIVPGRCWCNDRR